MPKPAKGAAVSPDDLIDCPGAARLIYVSEKTIRNWLSLKRLRRFKAGRRTLVSKSEVMAMVKEG